MVDNSQSTSSASYCARHSSGSRTSTGPARGARGEIPGILEALEEDLEAAGLGRQWLLISVKLTAIPEWIVEGFGGEPDDIGVRDEVSP